MVLDKVQQLRPIWVESGQNCSSRSTLLVALQQSSDALHVSGADLCHYDVEEEDKENDDGDDDDVDPGWAGSGQAGFRGFWGIENTVGMRTHSHKDNDDDDDDDEEDDHEGDDDHDHDNNVGNCNYKTDYFL